MEVAACSRHRTHRDAEQKITFSSYQQRLVTAERVVPLRELGRRLGRAGDADETGGSGPDPNSEAATREAKNVTSRTSSPFSLSPSLSLSEAAKDCKQKDGQTESRSRVTIEAAPPAVAASTHRKSRTALSTKSVCLPIKERDAAARPENTEPRLIVQHRRHAPLVPPHLRAIGSPLL